MLALFIVVYLRLKMYEIIRDERDRSQLLRHAYQNKHTGVRPRANQRLFHVDRFLREQAVTLRRIIAQTSSQSDCFRENERDI